MRKLIKIHMVSLLISTQAKINEKMPKKHKEVIK